MGNEHRTLSAKLCLNHKLANNKSMRKTKVGWKPDVLNKYQEQLDEEMEELKSADGWTLKKLDQKCSDIERVLLKVAAENATFEAAVRQNQTKLSRKARDLIAERKAARGGGVGRNIKDISKDIQRQVRRDMRTMKQERIATILDENRGLKGIAGIRNNGRRNFISSVVDDEGIRRTERQDIADAFAKFYETLYREGHFVDEFDKSSSDTDEDAGEEVKPINKEEVRDSLRNMKNNKAMDSAGLVAEMIKNGGERLLEVLANFFNELLVQGHDPPKDWLMTRLRVLFKKGDAASLENYRPVAVLPILLKLFSKIILERIHETLSCAQDKTQAGFKKGFSCDDILFALSLVVEAMTEWNQEFWIVAIDFRKAFDLVFHGSIWKSLTAQGVPQCYVKTLKRLYRNQKGMVLTDVSSKIFDIERGTKQGDPISPPLFNAALQTVMAKVTQKWRERKLGLLVDTTSEPEYLQELRFADDILLFANTKDEALQMLEDLATEAEKAGLQVHFGKTKVMSNLNIEGGEAEVRGNKVSMFPCDEPLFIWDVKSA